MPQTPQMPDWVVRYEMGSVRAPVEYHSHHGHAEKMGIVLYENSISREMLRRKHAIFSLQDAAEAHEASGQSPPAEQLTIDGETLEQHQKALDDLAENGQRASEAFAELSERVQREEQAKRRRVASALWQPRLL